MKKIIFLTGVCVSAALAMACGGGGNTNVSVNTGRMSNSASNAMNTVANTASNAANAVSNTVAKATTDDGSDFMKEAAQGGMAEVELGKLVATKAQNAEVKKFGQMMVT